MEKKINKTKPNPPKSPEVEMGNVKKNLLTSVPG
jgi:hypothetical protein